MAKVDYQIINAKENKFKLEGVEYFNIDIECYCSDSPSKKYLRCGDDTCKLKCRYDDFAYIIRAHNYKEADLPGMFIIPVFDRNGYVEDFTLCDPESGEVK